MRRLIFSLLLSAGIGAVAGRTLAQEQNRPPPPPAEAETEEVSQQVVYKPSSRGAPGGTVPAASRSASLLNMSLPVIELLAPPDHTGLTARPDPTLYVFISGPAKWPVQFTISAPLQPAPVLDVTIPSPAAAGIYALPTSTYKLRLQPSILYTWSVSIVVDPRAWSHNVVASATIAYDPTLAPVASLTNAPRVRVSDLAQAGLWYDAIAAAVDGQNRDRHLALDSLMQQVDLSDALAYDRTAQTR